MTDLKHVSRQSVCGHPHCIFLLSAFPAVACPVLVACSVLAPAAILAVALSWLPLRMLLLLWVLLILCALLYRCCGCLFECGYLGTLVAAANGGMLLGMKLCC